MAVVHQDHVGRKVRDYSDADRGKMIGVELKNRRVIHVRYVQIAVVERDSQRTVERERRGDGLDRGGEVEIVVANGELGRGNPHTRVATPTLIPHLPAPAKTPSFGTPK